MWFFGQYHHNAGSITDWRFCGPVARNDDVGYTRSEGSYYVFDNYVVYRNLSDYGFSEYSSEMFWIDYMGIRSRNIFCRRSHLRVGNHS